MPERLEEGTDPVRRQYWGRQKQRFCAGACLTIVPWCRREKGSARKSQGCALRCGAANQTTSRERGVRKEVQNEVDSIGVVDSCVVSKAELQEKVWPWLRS